MLTSVPNTPAAQNDKLEVLGINIKHWRKEKGLSFRFMPAIYWDEAVVLARLLGDRRVACVTGLNLDELKRRMQGRQAPGGHTATKETAVEDADTPQFIELPGIAATPPSAPQTVEKTTTESRASREVAAEPVAGSIARDAVVEITAANGDRMTLRMPVGSFNVSSLIHEFRSRA